jgi:hypothetical protein
VKCGGALADTRSMQDYLPRDDAALGPWAAALGVAAKNFLSGQGLDPTLAEKVMEVVPEFDAALAAAWAARDQARAATLRKLAARAELERACRTLAGFVQAWPGTTNADRANMGITVRAVGKGNAAFGIRDSAFGRKAPRIAAEQSARFTHRLRFVEGSGQEGIMKPRGVVGAEVYVALTAAQEPAPVGEEHYRYLRVITRDGVTIDYNASHAGRTAHYLCRWITTRGEVGAWGAGASATVAA